MAGIAVLNGPTLPAHAQLGFCLICASFGKLAALEGIKAAVEAHERSGNGVRRWPLTVPAEYCQPAVAFGLVPQLGALAPLCWSHLSIPSTTGLITAGPAGFNGGPPGVPLLGQ